MGISPRYNESFVKKVINAYSKGLSSWQICREFSISETNFYAILNKNPELRLKAKWKREELRLKKRVDMEKKSQKPKVNVDMPKKEKRSAEEKVKQLELQLRKEKEKNQELEKLLRVAKEKLGKY